MTSDRRRRWPLLVRARRPRDGVSPPWPSARPPTRAPTPSSSGSRVVLDENFDGDTLDESRWNTCHWWNDGGCTIASNNELEWYRPEQVDGGRRHPAADRRAEPVRGVGRRRRTTSPRAWSPPVRPRTTTTPRSPSRTGPWRPAFKAPAGRGLWPAIWLLPASKESRPEIDLLEMIGQDPSELILHFHPEDRDADSPSKRVRVTDPDLAERLAHGRPRLDAREARLHPRRRSRSGRSPATRCRPSRCTW